MCVLLWSLALGHREPAGVLTEAAGVGLSGPRVYRIYQSITAVLLVIVFIMAGYFVGLVGVNINGVAPSFPPDSGLHCIQEKYVLRVVFGMAWKQCATSYGC